MMADAKIWADVIADGQAHGLLEVGASAASVAKVFAGRPPVYLASPYSAEVVEDRRWQFMLSVRMQRFAAVAAADLALVGVTALSPIVLSSAMVHASQEYVAGRGRSACPWRHRIDPLDHAFWMNWCLPLFNACHAVVVPDIRGWSTSKGVLAEVKTALMLNMPVYLYATEAEA